MLQAWARTQISPEMIQRLRAPAKALLLPTANRGRGEKPFIDCRKLVEIAPTKHLSAAKSKSYPPILNRQDHRRMVSRRF